MYRVALWRAGVDSTTVNQRELEIRRKEEALQKKEERIREKPECMDQRIQESGRVFDAMNTLAAWESRLGGD